MLLNEYFETISLCAGRPVQCIACHRHRLYEQLHWHPFVEILVSLAEGNAVSVNFCRYELGINDTCCCTPAICTALRAAARTRI